MNARYDSRVITHFIVDFCAAKEIPISNLQLQKILFLVQYGFCNTFNELLFEENFEAWQYGPVLPSAYAEFKYYGGEDINKRFDQSEFEIIVEDDKAEIEEATEGLSQKNPWDLVAITHRANSPWSRVWKGGLGNHHPIPNDYLFDHA